MRKVYVVTRKNLHTGTTIILGVFGSKKKAWQFVWNNNADSYFDKDIKHYVETEVLL